tara:strand:+ start:927 stop:1259 length:333 start_codon:yes stop_codon:yes gene_type:complete
MMMKAIFNPAPVSRRGDPLTSRRAEHELNESGQRITLMEQCLDYVTSNQGQTAGEIGDGTGLGHMRVERRLSDLKNKGLLTQGSPRQWHGKAQVTWWLASTEEEQLKLFK